MDFSFPTVRFWADNGGEFRNIKMEEYVNKLEFKTDFALAFSPWSTE